MKSSEVLVIPDTHLVGAYFGISTSPVSSPGTRSVQPVRQGHQGTCTACHDRLRVEERKLLRTVE
jgi:hypothetical protein